MRRVLEIAVVAVASLGLAGLSVATCCVPEQGPCDHAHRAQTSVEVVGHCAGAPTPAIQAGCCASPETPAKDLGLTHYAPQPGAPGAASGPVVSAAAGAAPTPSRAGDRAPLRHSPILRL
jgi:hypothetical protein